MKTFSINTLGCKVNQYESRQIAELLTRFGLTCADRQAHADLLVVNTCCVTHIASAKSRQIIRKAQKLSPKATVLVTGCLPGGPAAELQNIACNIHVVAGKTDLTAAVEKILRARKKENLTTSPNKPFLAAEIKDKKQNTQDRDPWGLPALSSYSGQTRAFLKVQDGCDGYCTYCIVPHIRTKVCNKDVKSVLAETYNLVRAGHKEIVLTGIFLGAYGQDTVRRKNWDSGRSDSLAVLLEEVAQVPGIERVRLSSLEPGDVTERLIDVFCRHENIARHLHLPLQSGSDRILRRMCRQYRMDAFRKAVQMLALRLDRPAITTDIIVGFPGETEEDFGLTRSVMEEAGFAKSHIFPFSPREGTAAAKMQPAVNTGVIKERAAILRELDERMQMEFRSQFVGEEVKVIVESLGPARGRCGRYFEVYVGENGGLREGDVVKVRLGE